MRYEVIDQDGSGYKVVTTDNSDDPIVDLSEAEANIIAFALNAIADGFQLKAETGSPFGDALSGDQYQLREYDGPTEGVKP